MAYVDNGLVEASDFNSLVGNTITTTPNTLNGILATGSGTLGYGQTPVAQVDPENLVTAANEWNSLATKLGLIAAHQGTSIININAPVTGNTIAFSSVLENNLALVYTNRFNAALQGTSTTDTRTINTSWQDEITFNHVVAFVNGDAARYFFNMGGQFKITVDHPSGTNTNQMFNDLAANVGTVVISAPAAGTALIAGNIFSGVTRVLGGGNTPTIDTTRGYYGLSSSNVTVFSQTASTGPLAYRGSSVRIVLRTNGSQGTNNDNGSVVTISTIFKQVPNDIVLQSGTSTQLEVVFPETTFLANSWGNVSVTSSVIGS